MKNVPGTTNGGTTWDLLYHHITSYHAKELYVVNTAQIYVALDLFVIKHLDGGRSWEEIGNRSTAYATMGVWAPDGRNVWAASDNWAGGFIYHIPDGSTNWIDQAPTNGIWALDAPPVGYTGTLSAEPATLRPSRRRKVFMTFHFQLCRVFARRPIRPLM